MHRGRHLLRSVNPFGVSGAIRHGFCRFSTIDAHEHFKKGKEYVHTNQLNNAIREFKRAQLAFDESKESELIAKADTLFELGEAVIQVSDRKLLASGYVHKRYLFSSDAYSQAQSYFLQALDLYPKKKELVRKRALCWQRAASLQINYLEDLRESLELIKKGIEELPWAPELWEGYVKVINTLLLSEIEEKGHNEYTLDRNALVELVDIQVKIFIQFIPNEQKTMFTDIILNALRISGTYWNAQLQSIYEPYFQRFCTSDTELLEGNLMIAQAKYDTAEKQSTTFWYYGSETSCWNPYKVPDFCENVVHVDFTDLGEKEASAAVDYAKKISSDVDSFAVNHFLSKVYVTRKIRKDETHVILEECVKLADKLGNFTMSGVSYTQLGLYYLRWGRYSMADRAFRKAQNFLSGTTCINAAFDMYLGLIELSKRTNDEDSTENFYEEAITLVKGDDCVTDNDWQILLGYAIWLVEQEEYNKALNYIWEAIDNFKDVLYLNSILRDDPIGPWKCIRALLIKINSVQPELEEMNNKKFQNEVKALEGYFIESIDSVPLESELDISQYCYPKLFQLQGLQKTN